MARHAFEARVEELVRIGETRPMGKGELHLIFVGVADRDHSVARPHWASHPLPFLDDLPVDLKDTLADLGERFAALSKPQPSPPCSLITLRASLSSRNPANLECRRWRIYASHCNPSWHRQARP